MGRQNVVHAPAESNFGFDTGRGGLHECGDPSQIFLFHEHHAARGDSGQRSEHSFDFPELHAKSVYLYLGVPAAAKVKKAIGVELEGLGMEDKLRAKLEHEIGKPNGMILTTGPTGSGKTTTLYAFLRKVNTPGSKIITIEGPIE